MNENYESWAKSLEVFSSVTGFENDEFMGPSLIASSKKGLFISGPSRNGNHLLHSLLDNHPELPNIPGEDSVINEMFVRLEKEKNETLSILKDPALCCGYLSDLSGGGEYDKWKKIFTQQFGVEANSEKLWSGVFYGKSKTNFLFDYQGTEVTVDYPSFAQNFHAHTEKVLSSLNPRLCDIYFGYMKSLALLDPRSAKARMDWSKYDGISFGSGVRGSLEWLLECSDYVRALVPIRPFDTFYFSFAKGFYDTDSVSETILQEAWEHWHHKVCDYLRIKSKFQDRVMIIDFEDLVQNTKPTMKDVCQFLNVDFHPNCLTPTVLGKANKGNSSFAKGEDSRGKVYKAPNLRRLESALVPNQYYKYWQAVKYFERLSV